MADNITALPSVQLHYKDGANSDKVYNVMIVPAPRAGLYSVNFAYGRRGSTLQTGTKTNKPVDYNMAEKIMRQLVTAKMNKGYVDISTGYVPGTITAIPKIKTDVSVMLLTPIDEEEVESYLENDDWLMQEKIDGERRLIKAVAGVVQGINRKGLEVSLPEVLEKELAKLKYNNALFILDGEQIGDDYYAFDMVVPNNNITSYTFVTRYQSLALTLHGKHSHVHLVPIAEGFADKSKLYEKLKTDNKEGVVFKHKSCFYTPGRNSNAVKYKFYETASFVVSAINAQRSVQIAVMAGDACLPVGNVTILPNFPVPEIGAVVEVRYLYAYQGGSVYQPIYLGERSDISPSDCTMSQLKYKPNISLI